MPLRAEYELGCAALPLVSVAGSVPDVDITLEIAPGADEHPTFTATVAGAPETIDAVEGAFGTTAFVGDYRLVVQDGETRRYSIQPGTTMAEQLGDHLDDLDDLRALYDAPLSVDLIRVTPTGWRQRARFADRAAFDELRTFWQRNDVSFTLHKLVRDDLDAAFDPAGVDDGLTDGQRRALRTAHELGYFDVPRTATLEDVAAELDIAPSSLSERLRRAQTTLVERHVAEADRPGDHLNGRTTESRT